MTRTMAQLRAAARQHEEELISQKWFSPADLAVRWGFRSLSTVRGISRDELPYKEFGTGTRKRRRYRLSDVEAFEAARPLPSEGAA